jgi:hypothetical protein
MIGWIVRMRWADSGIITTGNATVGTVVRVHRPRAWVISMLHTWWRWFDVNGFRCGGRLWSRRRTVSGNAILRDTNCHRRWSGNAMRTLARRWYVPRIRKRANVGRRKRRRGLMC